MKQRWYRTPVAAYALVWILVGLIATLARTVEPLGWRTALVVGAVYVAVSTLVIWLTARFDFFDLTRKSDDRTAVLMGWAYGMFGAGIFAGIGAALTFSSSVALAGALVGAPLGFAAAYRYARSSTRLVPDESQGADLTPG